MLRQCATTTITAVHAAPTMFAMGAMLGRLVAQLKMPRLDAYAAHPGIQGAKSAVMTAHHRKDKISAWVLALRERAGWQKAVVALANSKRLAAAP